MITNRMAWGRILCVGVTTLSLALLVGRKVVDEAMFLSVLGLVIAFALIWLGDEMGGTKVVEPLRQR